MRFILVDAALRNNEGHHANSCQLILREVRARGIETIAFANVEAEPGLLMELRAKPLFRYFPYWLSDGDPICGWLNAFYSGTTLTTQDLARIPIHSDDLIFFNSVQPAQLMACISWFATIPPEQQPRIVIEFGTGVMLATSMTPQGPTLVLPEPRVDPTGMLFHFVGGQMKDVDTSRIRLITYHATTSRIMEGLLNRRVSVVPFPYQATNATRIRAGERPITLALLGFQRPDKGYHLLPALLPRLLNENPAIRILVHNSASGRAPELDMAMMKLSTEHPRFEYEPRVVDSTGWSQLIDRADLILCPYDGTRYIVSHSGIAVEAIANAIPLVVPARTPLADIAAEYGGAATCFANLSIEDIAAAVKRAIDSFDAQAKTAQQAALAWSRNQGAHHTIDAVLALASSPGL